MYFRFAAGLMLVVLVSMAGVWLEKQTLEMRRTVTVQYYQTDVLFDLLVRLRLETQQLTAPSRIAIKEKSESRRLSSPRDADRGGTHGDDSPESSVQRLPLLRFQRPFNPEGID